MFLASFEDFVKILDLGNLDNHAGLFDQSLGWDKVFLEGWEDQGRDHVLEMGVLDFLGRLLVVVGLAATLALGLFVLERILDPLWLCAVKYGQFAGECLETGFLRCPIDLVYTKKKGQSDSKQLLSDQWQALRTKLSSSLSIEFLLTSDPSLQRKSESFSRLGTYPLIIIGIAESFPSSVMQIEKYSFNISFRATNVFATVYYQWLERRVY